MAKVHELHIKNKYTGEIIGTVPADTPETVNDKIQKVHKNQYLLTILLKTKNIFPSVKPFTDQRTKMRVS